MCVREREQCVFVLQPPCCRVLLGPKFEEKLLPQKKSRARSTRNSEEEARRTIAMAKLGKNVKGKSKKLAKGEKKAGASEAEKRLQMRLQKMKESDFRKKFWQKRRADLKASMEREQKLSRMNLLKIQNQWRNVMRLAKVQSLRRDVDVLAQSNERDVDRKDAIIQMLDRDLEEAEDQYQMALRNHMSGCEKLVNLQDSRLISLESDFLNELKAIEKDFADEKREIETKHGRTVSEIEATIEAVDSREREREVQVKHEHERYREDIKNKNLEDINVLRITLEHQIEELEKQFENAHMQYLRSTDRQTEEFKKLTRTDLEQSKQIEHKIRRIERLQSARNQLLAKINQNTRECKERNKALETEKQQLVSHSQDLKSRMEGFRYDQARRLKRLTKYADTCKKTLCERKSIAERILKLAERARKYETETEKILPFGDAEASEASSKIDDSVSDEATRVIEEEVKELKAGVQQLLKAPRGGKSREMRSFAAYAPKVTGVDGKPVQEWHSLDLFYKKYNRALLDKLIKERERDRLLQENEDLQSILKQYLDGISVNEDVLSRANPLLVVNDRLGIHRQTPVTRTTGNHVSIDGRHMVNTGRVATRRL